MFPAAKSSNDNDRQQREKKERRNKKKRRRNNNKPSIDVDDIDELLRQQRLKKQNERETATSSGENDKPPRLPRKKLGGYVYDAKLCTYFPEKFVSDESRVFSQNNGNEEKEFEKKNRCSSARYRKYPYYPIDYTNMHRRLSSQHLRPAILAHASQLCGGDNVQQRRLLRQWSGRLQLESLRVQQVEPLLFLRDSSHPGAAPDFPFTVLDSVRTTVVAPWVRSFDVIPSDDNKNPPCFISMTPTNGMEQRHVKVLTCRNVPRVGRLKMLERTTCFTLFDAAENSSINVYGCYREINDFALLHQHDCIIMGGNKSKRFRFNYIDVESDLIELGFSNSSGVRSDILCVETDCSGSRPHISLCGHRNGQITLQDIRTSSCIGAVNSIQATGRQNFKSVVAMKLLFVQRPDQLLARSSNGLCRLFDLRRLGGPMVPDTHTSSSSSSLVHELSPPFEQFDAFPSVGGVVKGLATDPLQTTAIVPFVDKDHEACLGLWSLDSGDFIGDKQVNRLPGMTSMRMQGGDCLDLCSTLTRAWSFRNGLTEDDAELVPGSYGLWFNWGSRGIHHVKFNGRIDD